MRLFLVILTSLTIAILSLANVSAPRDLPSWLDSLDKAAHFGMYGLYAIILLSWRRCPEGDNRQGMILTILWAAFYGMLMEILQELLPRQMREFSWGDAIANALGATVGAFVWRQRRISRPSSKA